MLPTAADPPCQPSKRLTFAALTCPVCSLPDEVRGEGVLVHFEATSVHEAVKMIKKMSQRDLQVRCWLHWGASMECQY